MTLKLECKNQESKESLENQIEKVTNEFRKKEVLRYLEGEIKVNIIKESFIDRLSKNYVQFIDSSIENFFDKIKNLKKIG